jgi:diaminohydroxyphosphoribosylaminopyrimidine deaminase/5-amino-6-(5-phosphoribosylamino)uracil reductase
MKLRRAHDAILVGINTVLADNPALTARPFRPDNALRRVILDSRARTPLHARLVTDNQRHLTTIVVTRLAPRHRVQALREKVNVVVAPRRNGRVDLSWLLRELGEQAVTSLLVEGGGEVNAAFLEAGLAQRVAFFYAPKILGDPNARRAVAGRGAGRWEDVLRLEHPSWSRFGPDLFLTATVAPHP